MLTSDLINNCSHLLSISLFLKFSDGTITISFTNNDAYKNVIHICQSWTYTIRFYEPGREILDHGWTLPEPLPLTPEDA